MITLNKCLKVFLLLVVICKTTSSFAQNQVTLGVYQDIRLLFFGDESSNHNGTMDLILNLNVQTKQDAIGYFVINTEYEQANIQETLKRYSVNAGYTFNRLGNNTLPFLQKFEINTSIGCGVIDRHDNFSTNFSANLGLFFRINEFVKISLKNQFLDRTDLMFKYKKREFRHSLFFGLEFSLFKLNNKPVQFYR